MYCVHTVFNTNSILLVVKQHTQDLGLDQHVQIWVLSILQTGVEVRVGSILTLALRRDVSQPAFKLVAFVQTLKILSVFVANLSCCCDEVFHAVRAAESTVGDVDGTVLAVCVVLARPVVCLEAFEVRQDLIGAPAFGVPAVKVGLLCAGVPGMLVSN